MVGQTVTALNWCRMPGYFNAAFFTGTIKLVTKPKGENTTWYQIEYIDENEHVHSRMVYEDEIDFVHMTIR
jgi:hypothetical protein